MKTATRMWLTDRVEIRVIWAPAYLATKLEAFASRGRGDLLSSHDLEDILNVVDGRPSIVDELQTASDALRKFVRGQLGNLLSQPNLEARGSSLVDWKSTVIRNLLAFLIVNVLFDHHSIPAVVMCLEPME